MTADEAMYLLVVKEIFRRGVPLRIWSRAMLNSHAEYVQTTDFDPEIRLRRDRGQDSLDSSSTDDEILRLAREADDIVKETIVLAHELGHHESPNKDYEAIMKGRGSDRLTPDKRARILEEENRAWDEAERLLVSLQFAHPARLAEVRRESLQSYEDGV